MSAIEAAVAWVFSIVVALAPPGRKSYYPDAAETQEEAEVRLQDLSGDLVEIVFDPNTPSLFKGERGRSRTATLVLAVILNESGFRKDVDFGLGKYSRGDGGRSWCLMQLNVGKEQTLAWNYVENRMPRWGDPEENIFDGYYGPDLVQDRRACISEGHKYMRASMQRCKSNPLNRSLAGYVSGKCDDGFEGSESRFRTAARWLQAKKQLMTFTDKEVMEQWADWQKARHPFVISTRTSTNELREEMAAASQLLKSKETQETAVAVTESRSTGTRKD